MEGKKKVLLELRQEQMQQPRVIEQDIQVSPVTCAPGFGHLLSNLSETRVSKTVTSKF